MMNKRLTKAANSESASARSVIAPTPTRTISAENEEYCKNHNSKFISQNYTPNYLV